MTYRFEATSVQGFIQQVAVSYLSRGYYFFVQGYVKEPKSLQFVDDKLTKRYDTCVSKWARARSKRAGNASIQYIRFERTFLLLATHGRHRFFEDEAGNIKDARRTPIRLFGYSLSCRGGHAHVRIDESEFKRFKAWMLERAIQESLKGMRELLSNLDYVPYAPVRGQLLSVWRHVNRSRLGQGLEPVPFECLCLKRKIVKPFD